MKQSLKVQYLGRRQAGVRWRLDRRLAGHREPAWQVAESIEHCGQSCRGRLSSLASPLHAPLNAG